MSDRIFFALALAVALAAIALALQWPQGLGARASGPFGRETYAERLARTTPRPAPAQAAAAQLKGGL